MTYDNFTIKAQESILKAQQVAGGLNQQSVDTAHLMRGIIQIDDQLVDNLFNHENVNTVLLRREINSAIEHMPKVKDSDKQFLSPSANKALSNARKSMKDFGDEFISIELILLGILKGTDKTAKMLKNLGATTEGFIEAIKELRQGKKVTEQNDNTQYNSLKKYAINLNEKAENGELDPIIGRDEEIRRILHILSRRKKNNPILIGEAGVGKTAIIEGLAWRIVDGDVPQNLQSKQIYSLDMASIIAGAKYKGEFEERLKGLVDEVINSDGEVILFIDEIHTLIGAGGGNGAMDAANILKPALARGELRTIGATTHDEYQKYFEEDKALVRRFQTVNIDEPSVEETISILRGLQERYEVYHKIEIKDEALVAAAELSSRYITSRMLPDKAIDLIDEAAAKLRLELDSVPDEIDELDRKVRQYEIEKEAIKREENKKKLSHINELLANAKEDYKSAKAKWENEKNIVDNVQNIKKQIEELELLADKAERESDFEKVAKIRYGDIKEKEILLKAAEDKLEDMPEESRMTTEDVTANDIADIVARWTGIPVKKMLKSERDKILHLEDEIHKRLVGQHQAVVAVSDAVRRSRSGLGDSKRPIGSFIFLGPTGVGKTELAKSLAEVLFDDENAITRIDMSEYQEKHSVSRLVGAPPGYVGYEEGGQLTEAVRRKPYSIVLLDEIEKAHPDTFNILLQLLDDGRLTDNKGRVVNFKNTIVIMTSNMGAQTILENFEDLAEVGEKHRKEIIETTEEEVFELLKENLKPEFLNRIDEKIMFLPLTKDEIKIIAGFVLKKLKKNLNKQAISIEFSPEAMDLLAEHGYEPQFGARPLKRVIQKEIVNELSKKILSAEFSAGDSIYVSTKDDKFIFKYTKETKKSDDKKSDKKGGDEKTVDEKKSNTKHKEEKKSEGKKKAKDNE